MNYTYSSASSDEAWLGRYGKVTWHGVMANVRYEWLQRGPVTLYSHVGIGALVEYYSPSWEDTYNRTNMAFQVSPAGVRSDALGNIKAGIRVGF